jgi:large subunit ribosomal protein L31
MTRVCKLTGTRARAGNNRSRAINKIMRRLLPNLHSKRTYVPELGRSVRLRIWASTITTLNRKRLMHFLKHEGLTLRDVSDVNRIGCPEPDGARRTRVKPLRPAAQGTNQGATEMKEGIHPEYHAVVFQDASTGWTFLTRSTKRSERRITWDDGNEYPLVTMEISSSSHPYYTGTQRLVDTAGRVERFRERYGRRADAPAAKTGTGSLRHGAHHGRQSTDREEQEAHGNGGEARRAPRAVEAGRPQSGLVARGAPW